VIDVVKRILAKLLNISLMYNTLHSVIIVKFVVIENATKLFSVLFLIKKNQPNI